MSTHLRRCICLLALAACASAPSAGPRVRSRLAPEPPSSPPSSSPAGLSASIARVEHGLVLEVRIKGDHAGWSIDERLRAHHVPGVSIAVIHDHRVAWSKAYGLADADTGAPLNDTTLMQAGSISKMVTALAALKAVEKGRLRLDANVNDALRTWHLPDNDLTRATPVTLKQLLSHTAGVNIRGAPGYLRGEALPTLLQVLDGKPPATTPPIVVDLPPGTKFRYSSGGALVVQQMLVDLEGRPFPALMNAAVFTPFGMAHSTFDEPSVPAAASHDIDGKPLPGKHRIYPEMAAGGLWTTPRDLARLVAEVQLGLEGRSALVSKEIATEMTAPVLSLGDDMEVSLGTFVERHGGGVYFGHDGLGEGFLAMARASKTKGEGAVILANGWHGFSGAPLLLEIMRSIAAEYGWDGWLPPPIELAAIDASRLDALAGRYGTGVDGSIVIAREGERLGAREPFKERCELLPVSEDTFVCRTDGARFTFNSQGLVKTSTSWPGGGSTATLGRMPGGVVEPLVRLEAGHFEDALASYKKINGASASDPTTLEERFDDIGMDLLYRQLAADKAILVFRVNVALHPASARACAALAEAYARAGRSAEAAPLYAKTKALFARDTKMGEWDRIYLQWKLATLARLGL